jgi:hypothetical protein
LSYQADPYLDIPLSPFKSDLLSDNSLESCNLGYKIQAVYQQIS